MGIDEAGGDADVQASVQRGPAETAIGAAQHVAAQAVDQHFTGLADHAEVAALIRRLQGGEALLSVIPFQQQALFADDVQPVTGRGDGVEVKALRVVGAILERRPALATVFGPQDQVEHTDHIAQLVVGEPHIEQRLVCPLFDQPLTFGDQQWPLLVGRLGTGQRRIMLDQQIANLATIELLVPGGASIAAVQYHAVIAHRPALAVGRKTHRRQITAERHGGLLPVLADVVGKQNVATLADGNHALAGAGHAGQRTVDRQGADPGGQVQHIDVPGRLGDALQQAEHNAKRQLHNIIFIRTHTASSSENPRQASQPCSPTFKPAPTVIRGTALKVVPRTDA
ncbi:hypothetical protein PS914_05562 [Pseudomonas fluorescens]|nr:hypothetical protein PS914_05562 [Pseudomonas fluorescens]